MNAQLIVNAELSETPEPVTTIAEYTETAAALADLRKRYGSAVFDVRTGKGMTEAKAARAELRDHRVSLEKERVRIKAPALERCRQIDSEAKRITIELESLEDPITDQIKAEEDRKSNAKAEAERLEAERIAAINARFDAIRALPLRAVDATVEQINAVIAEAEAIDVASFPDDLTASAKFEQRLAINALRAALDRREAYDAEQLQIAADRAELQRLRDAADAVQAEADRLAQLERDRVEAEERVAEEALQALRDQEIRQQAIADTERRHAEEIEQARLEAIAVAEQAAIDRVAAELAAEESRAQAVRETEARIALEQRIADEQREHAEAAQRVEDERRAANRKHVGSINRKARDAFMVAGFDEEQATRIVSAIVAGRVPAVSIAY